MLLILKELGLSASYLRGVGLFFFGLTPVERGELGQEDNPLVEVVLHTKEIFHLSDLILKEAGEEDVSPPAVDDGGVDDNLIESPN